MAFARVLGDIAHCLPDVRPLVAHVLTENILFSHGRAKCCSSCFRGRRRISFTFRGSFPRGNGELFPVFRFQVSVQHAVHELGFFQFLIGQVGSEFDTVADVGELFVPSIRVAEVLLHEEKVE